MTRARKTEGLSLKELSRKCSIPKKRLYAIEHGTETASDGEHDGICAGLGFTEAELPLDNVRIADELWQASEGRRDMPVRLLFVARRGMRCWCGFEFDDGAGWHSALASQHVMPYGFSNVADAIRELEFSEGEFD